MTDDTPIRHTPLPSHQDGRQTARLAEAPALFKQKHEQLACELAMNMEEADVIFARYGYTAEQAVALCESPAFMNLLERVTKEVRESGLSFKTKAKAIAEESLPFAYEMLSNPDCSAAVRLGVLTWIARMAGHEPKEDKKADGPQSGGLSLNITFSGQPTQAVLAVQEARVIEQEGV